MYEVATARPAHKAIVGLAGILGPSGMLALRLLWFRTPRALGEDDLEWLTYRLANACRAGE